MEKNLIRSHMCECANQDLVVARLLYTGRTAEYALHQIYSEQCLSRALRVAIMSHTVSAKNVLLRRYSGYINTTAALICYTDSKHCTKIINI